MDDRYSTYRQIRAERTWRPLGKMTWWRIILGLALLLFVFLLSGFFSQQLAAAGHFKAAERLMVSPSWMETYKPELKAYIEAGVLYQDGAYEQARDAFAEIEDWDAAQSMKNVSALKLAEQTLQSGDAEKAAAILDEVDDSLLSKDDMDEYLALCEMLAS